VHLRSAVVDEVARHLEVLASAIPAREVPADAAPLGAGGCLRLAVAVVLVLAVLVGFVGAAGVMGVLGDAYLPLDRDFYRVVVPVGAGVWLLALPLVGLAVRGRSDSFRLFIALAAVLIYAVPCYTVSTILVVNGACDGSAPTRRTSRVMARWVTSGKHAGNHLRLAGLRRGDDPFEMDVDDATYARFAKDDAVVVTTGEGALGWEWIRRIDPALSTTSGGSARPRPLPRPTPGLDTGEASRVLCPLGVVGITGEPWLPRRRS
jgi:hypothetical protein